MANSLFDIDDEHDANDDRRDAAANERAAVDFLTELEDMQNDERYGWAIGTIEGIHETVSRTREVTSNQRRAIENIAAKAERGYR